MHDPTEVARATNRPANANSEGTRYLRYEEQERPKTSDSFVRVVQLMENQNGVQDSGSLRFSFDAEFQELWLHRVVVHRGGKTIDRLNQSKVRIIQPESELNDHMFTGSQTAVLFVEDLRVGDALEYAYTVHGRNPILGKQYSNRFTIQTSDPQYRETVGHCCPGAAKIIGNPGERQPRLFERIPQRLGPLTFLGLVDGCRLAQILKDPGRGIDDDVVGGVVHIAVRSRIPPLQRS